MNELKFPKNNKMAPNLTSNPLKDPRKKGVSAHQFV